MLSHHEPLPKGDLSRPVSKPFSGGWAPSLSIGWVPGAASSSRARTQPRYLQSTACRQTGGGGAQGVRRGLESRGLEPGELLRRCGPPSSRV